MFDLVRNNKKIVQIFLALICLPFAFFGVESYMNQQGVGADLAKVGDIKISRYALDEAMREAEQAARQNNPNYDAKTFNSLENRRLVLNNLINRQLIALEVERLRLMVTDEQIRQLIASQEAFQENGAFSNARYTMILQSQGLTPQRFEDNVRRDLTLQQAVNGFVRSNIVADSTINHLLQLQTDKRTVEIQMVRANDFLKEVQLDENAAKAYYDSHQREFYTPERAQIEYVVFSPASIAQNTEIAESEIKEWYVAHSTQFAVPEERRASHILIEAASTDDAAKQKARAKAEKILAELKKSPKKFAQIAKRESSDLGSKKDGGDLGFFTKDVMDEAFAKAAFELKKNQLSGVVESEFGFHIILLTDIRAARTKTLAQARSEIVETLKADKAQRFFNENAEEFANIVYDQADSLSHVAQRLKLNIETTDWLEKNKPNDDYPFLTDEVLKRVFSKESIDEKRNTESLDIGGNTLVSARIKNFEPSVLKEFASVEREITDQLRLNAAMVLAANAATEKLKKPENEQWGEKLTISRFDSVLHETTLPSDALRAIFAMPTADLPVYSSVELPNVGTMLLRLNEIVPDLQLDELTKTAMKTSIKSLYAERDWALWVLALRDKYKVEINEKALAEQN